jgi:hypothetical protein
VLIDRLLVERIHLRRLGYPSGGADLFGHLLEPRQGTTGEKDRGSLASEGTADRAADRPTAP